METFLNSWLCVRVCVCNTLQTGLPCGQSSTCQLLNMASLWGIYGFTGFWSGQLIPIAINIPGRLNCRNVKGKFRNISTFQTHEPFGLQMWGKRGVL